MGPAPLAPLFDAALPAGHAQSEGAQALGISWGQAAHQPAGLVDREARRGLASLVGHGSGQGWAQSREANGDAEPMARC